MDAIRQALPAGFRSTRGRKKPTEYPHIPFHFLRAAQLLSSIVVGSVMFYFVFHLSDEGYGTPWTFIFLLSVSCLTVAALAGTMILHLMSGLNPRLNLALNGSLLVIWTLGFSLLAWWSSGTLGHVCNKANWQDETGIMVCRIYKALFAFSLLGFLSTIGAALLDIYVFRRASRLGKYNQMADLDHKSAPRDMNAEEQGINPFEDGPSMPKPYADSPALGKKNPEQHGYAVPEEQFGYDTGYQGAAGEVAHLGK